MNQWVNEPIPFNHQSSIGNSRRSLFPFSCLPSPDFSSFSSDCLNRRLLGVYCEREVKMATDWKDHIASDPEILRGKPRIKGTRIPVSLILGHLAAGQAAENIIAEYPDLTREQIAACLDYARALAEFEVTA
jgi:uncharacterized protein (DUF433 family)